MMERNWTKPQADAIYARGGSVLVSAAAGSGKTAVLVERVVELLCDPQNPVDADRLLVVTFSRAAAAEMKQRMGERLAGLIHREPGNLHLLRQQALLGRAQVSTVDSFCLDLVRQNFQTLRVSPDFAILDQSELTILMDDCAADCIAAFYEEDDTGLLPQLVELLSSGRDDRQLAETILKIYEYSRSHPFSQEWLGETLELYDTQLPVAETLWGRSILDHAEQSLGHCARLTGEALEAAGWDEALQKAYGPALLSDLAQLKGCAAPVEKGDWDGAVEALAAFAFQRLGSVRGDDPLKTRVQSARAQVKEIVGELRERLLNATGAQFREDLEDLRPKIQLLFAMVEDFSRRLWEAKMQKKRLHFADLEHLALQLLVERDPDGTVRPTAHAREIASQYDYVLVDEYQDTNQVQDMIFTCVSQNQQNLFMVGDVKQSIYGFRQAMPQIFMAKKEAFFPYDAGQYPAKIILDTNFRSRREVVGAVNAIFSGVMSREWGEVAYTHEESLKCGAAYAPYHRASPQLLLIDLSEYQGEREAAAIEAEEIAKTIKGMLADGYQVEDRGELRPAALRDFCILMRSPKNRAPLYVEELARQGVAAVADQAGGYLAAREVSAVVALLRALDNPLLDIELVAAMLSPLFGFDADQITRIRLARREGPFFTALCAMAEEDEACARFLRQFSLLRAQAAILPAHRLLLRIYDETDALAVFQAMEMGESRRANLLLLVEYAADYHAMGYKQLGGFVGFLGRLAEKEGDLAPAVSLGDGADAVRVMSIHRSKGLEFPVVFLADMAKAFNKVDLRRNTLLHPTFGFACVRRDPVSFKQYPTVPMQAIRLEAQKSILSEEMRVFYVALTRAREKLILTGTVKSGLDRKLAKLCHPALDGRIPPYQVGRCGSFLDWTLAALLHLPSCGALREVAGAEDLDLAEEASPWEVAVLRPQLDQGEDPSQRGEEKAAPAPDLEWAARLARMGDWAYPYQWETQIPAKLPVSAAARGRQDVSHRFAARPRFLSRQKLTPAERGSAMHKFMQFAGYRQAREDLEGEIARMAREEFLSPAECESLQRDKLGDFFASRLCGRIFESERVWRELRFMAECGGDRLGDLVEGLGESRIVLQGVADCVFVEEGAAVIVDYKTDRVADPQQLRDRYAGQLSLYRLILAESLKIPVKECVLYSFSLSEAVKL